MKLSISQIKSRIKERLTATRQPRILLFMNLPQDLDMLLPIARQLKETAEQTACTLEVAVSDKAWNQSPRINRLLEAADIQPKIYSHEAVVAGLLPSLNNVKAVITASESTANAHKGPHTLTQRANRKGIPTYTMQHGFDNVGVTYFDEEYPVGKIAFASQTFFTWGKTSELPPETPAETAAKCIAVGCPKFIAPALIEIDIAQQIPTYQADKPLLVVFENLHWSRYSDSYRQQFLQDLEQSAIAHPDATIIIKPHHTGLWLTKRYQGKMPAASNLIIADPKDPKWETFTAPALIQIADAVITTPSTVAIDAARSHTPVAVVACDLDLPRYEPLPLLRDRQDWQTFIQSAGKASLPAVEKFLHERLLPGDAASRIVNRVLADIASPPSSR